MTGKKGWGMTKEERIIKAGVTPQPQMQRRRQVARDRKSSGLSTFIDDPIAAIQQIDARVLREQETIKDAEAKIATSKLKIQRLDALRKVLTSNEVDFLIEVANAQ